MGRNSSLAKRIAAWTGALVLAAVPALATTGDAATRSSSAVPGTATGALVRAAGPAHASRGPHRRRTRGHRHARRHRGRHGRQLVSEHSLGSTAPGAGATTGASTGLSGGGGTGPGSGATGAGGSTGSGSGSGSSGGGSGTGSGSGGGGGTGGSSLPTRTGVDEGEYYVRPTHRTVAAGPVDFYPVDLGMDSHDMTIRDGGGNVVGTVPIDPGQTAHIKVNLTPGTYTLFCSLYDHELRGMHASLTVQ